jgi:hypothetical protein
MLCQVAEIVKEIFGKDPSRGVNPDEVVAMGAAIQGESPDLFLAAQVSRPFSCCVSECNRGMYSAIACGGGDAGWHGKI